MALQFRRVMQDATDLDDAAVTNAKDDQMPPFAGLAVGQRQVELPFGLGPIIAAPQAKASLSN